MATGARDTVHCIRLTHHSASFLQLKGLQYFNARLRMLEKRQHQIREIRAKHEKLKTELEDAKNRLMLDPNKWVGECKFTSELLSKNQVYVRSYVYITDLFMQFVIFVFQPYCTLDLQTNTRVYTLLMHFLQCDALPCIKYQNNHFYHSSCTA